MQDELISREATLNPYKGLNDEDTISVWLIRKNIEQQPSVTPQQKIGHWIRVTDKTGHLVWECDKCGWQQRFNNNFCPDCGAKMVESQESDDEE